MVVFTKKNVRFNIGSTVNTLLVLVGGEKRIFRKREHKIQDFYSQEDFHAAAIPLLSFSVLYCLT